MNKVDSSENSARLDRQWRRALPRWLQCLVLMLVFGAGGVAGSVVTTKWIHSRSEAYRQSAPIFAQDISTRLRMRLRLTDKQAGQVKAILERRHSQMIAYRNEGSQRVHNEFNAMVEEVETVLTDRQVERWESIAERVRTTYLPAFGQ